MKKPFGYVVLSALLLCGQVYAADTPLPLPILPPDASVQAQPDEVKSGTQTVRDIRVEGLNTIAPDVVFSVLSSVPLNSVPSQATIADAIQNIYALGYFTDVRVYQDGDLLVFALQERDILVNIITTGNKLVPDEGVKGLLESLGVQEGKVLVSHAIHNIITAIRTNYEDQGYFGVQINVETNNPRPGYVDLTIEIQEKSKVALERIIINGNHHLDDDELLDVMQLQSRSLFQLLPNSYSSAQLNADIEAIRALYLAQGYLDAEIISSSVKISPDEEGIYIIIEITEGEQYRVRNTSVKSDSDFFGERFRAFVGAMEQKTYNQNAVNGAEEYMQSVLANNGYLYAEASVSPTLHRETHEVDLAFVVETKERQQVRFVHFHGNVTTADSVLRREMRQFENTTASQRALSLSRSRLLRLGYFQEVKIEHKAVQPGVVDIVISVIEQKRQTLSANLSYSEVNGGGLGAEYSSINVLGTGQDVSIAFSFSSGRDNIRLSHYIPTFLDSEFSLRTTLYYDRLNLNEDNIANYRRENNGLRIALGYPLSERQRIEYGITFDQSSITIGSSPTQEITRYINDEGTSYLDYLASVTHTYSSLNSGFLPTSGVQTNHSIEAALPSSDSQFIVLSSRFTSYVPLWDELFIWRFNSRLSHGLAYGDSIYFPFYRYFNVGGLSSLRGFQFAGVGPRSTEIDGALSTRAFGGNVMAAFRSSLIYATEGMKEHNVRMSFFVDAANVYNTNCILINETCNDTIDFNLKSSYGVSVVWYSVIAPMTFSYGIPINATDDDRTQEFQFGLGVATF